MSCAVFAPCIALFGTPGAWLSLLPSVSLPPLPSCLPSLGGALLSPLLSALRRCGTMKALTPAPFTYGAGLPVYLATPSYRSVSNHVGASTPLHPPRQRIRLFRASPWNRRLVAALRRIEFVILRTDSSPPVALHVASGPTQLPSATELWHTPTRTFTVLVWRHHGRTVPPATC